MPKGEQLVVERMYTLLRSRKDFPAGAQVKLMHIFTPYDKPYDNLVMVRTEERVFTIISRDHLGPAMPVHLIPAWLEAAAKENPDAEG